MIQLNRMGSAATALAALSLSVLSLAQTASPGRPEKTAPPAGAARATTAKPDRMSMADFRKLFTRGDLVVVDVRSIGMYRAGHIPGALSIPEDNIDTALAEKLKRMGKPIATYCS